MLACAQDLHEQYVETFAEQQERLARAEREAAEFHAAPLPHYRPFTVHPSDAPVTVPQEQHLETEARAPKRQKFSKTMELKMRKKEVRCTLARAAA